MPDIPDGIAGIILVVLMQIGETQDVSEIPMHPEAAKEFIAHYSVDDGGSGVKLVSYSFKVVGEEASITS